MPGISTVIEEARSAHPRTRLRLYDAALRLAGLGVWECDLATERLTWSEGVHRIFDYPTDLPLVRSVIVDLYAEESRRDMERLRSEAIRTGQSVTLDTRIRTYRGEERWMRLAIDVERIDGKTVRIFGAKQDISADRNLLERLKVMAGRDHLTGLANRATFDAHYLRVVEDGLDYDGIAALALIDLDHFKPINDTFGHLAGDACLAEIATRLRRMLPHASLIARLGGDEFAVLLRAPVGHARIERMLDKANAALSRPFIWNGISLALSTSMGAAIIQRPHPRPIGKLFAEADRALYEAKAAGRNTISIFGSDSARRRRRIFEPTDRDDASLIRRH